MGRWFALVLAVWLPIVAAAMDPRPAELDLTADELAQLAAGEVVIRLEQTEGGGTSVGVVDVAAPPGRTMDAVLDLPPRVNESGALKEAAVTSRAPPRDGAPERMTGRFLVKVMGSTIVFHMAYEIDRAAGWSTFRLDESQPNDIVSADGSYHVYAIPGGSRVVYRSRSDSGRSVPEWIKRWLANNALRDQLVGIRARAQGA